MMSIFRPPKEQLSKTVREDGTAGIRNRKKLPGKLLSSSKRRNLIIHIIQTLYVSQRRACEALGQYRTTQRYLPNIGAEKEKLAVRIIDYTVENGL